MLMTYNFIKVSLLPLSKIVYNSSEWIGMIYLHDDT